MSEQSSTLEIHRENDGYSELEFSIKTTFWSETLTNRPLFTTDATGLFDLFLENLPEDARQHYTCNACRHFVDRYAGLVTIEDDGQMTDVMWGSDIPLFFRKSVESVKKAVQKSKVTGVFFSNVQVLGQPVTGEWTHMNAELSSAMVYNERVKSVNEITSEKKADFTILMSGLQEYPLQAIDQALLLLETETLYRSEKVIGVAKWLKELHTARNATKNKKLRDNLVWRAVATAPPGYVHVKQTMVGTLLDDIVAGLPFEIVSRRFSEKMNPTQYQRPQVAPSRGNIEQAERIVEKLGIQKSLIRRFARIDEIQTIWKPTEEVAVESNGVFGHIKPKDAADIQKMNLPTITMTWKKFLETVLPTAKNIEYDVKAMDYFAAILTAQHYDAPPIFQWDSEESRNPFSHYLYQGTQIAAQWNVMYGFQKVTGICYQPSMWKEGFDHQGKAVFFIIEGVKDMKYKTCGNGLFPEILKSELRDIRSTIEAYSRSAEVLGYEEASACGIRLQYGMTWNAVVRVTSETGVATYKLDRWD